MCASRTQLSGLQHENATNTAAANLRNDSVKQSKTLLAARQLFAL